MITKEEEMNQNEKRFRFDEFDTFFGSIAGCNS
jgi:hypothetical protein